MTLAGAVKRYLVASAPDAAQVKRRFIVRAREDAANLPNAGPRSRPIRRRVSRASSGSRGRWRKLRRRTSARSARRHRSWRGWRKRRKMASALRATWSVSLDQVIEAIDRDCRDGDEVQPNVRMAVAAELASLRGILQILVALAALSQLAAAPVVGRRLDGPQHHRRVRASVRQPVGEPGDGASQTAGRRSARIVPFLWQSTPQSADIGRGSDMPDDELRSAIRENPQARHGGNRQAAGLGAAKLGRRRRAGRRAKLGRLVRGLWRRHHAHCAASRRRKSRRAGYRHRTEQNHRTAGMEWPDRPRARSLSGDAVLCGRTTPTRRSAFRSGRCSTRSASRSIRRSASTTTATAGSRRCGFRPIGSMPWRNASPSR